MTTRSKITAVNFTYALADGLWVRREDGSSTWLHFDSLIREVGATEAERLRKIAYANGWTGMWYNYANGRNCYVNGQLVNA